MELIPTTHVLILSSIIFGIGIYGVLARNNSLIKLICIQLMFSAIILNFSVFSREYSSLTGTISSIFIILLMVAEVVAALAIIFNIYRYQKLKIEFSAKR